MKNRRQTGADYEEKAAKWLEEQGFRIVERNFWCRLGEIDLIARDGRYLVFVEVKYRSGLRAGDPAEAVDIHKQRRIARTALYYCSTHGIQEEQPCRFDVVSIQGQKFRHLKNAFGM